MIRDLGEELCTYSQETFGSNLRAVTRYSQTAHDPIYTREDIPEKIGLDEDTRSMFRLPLVRMQNSVTELSEYHPTLDSPDVSVNFFGDIVVLQFPISDEGGIIITLDWEGSLPEQYISRCKSITGGSACTTDSGTD